MKTAALKRFRQKLAADHPVYGLWITLESASISEMAVALGLDWICIDAEHGHLDWNDILQHLRATVRSDTVALVRVAETNAALIKRALDIGADGIVVPWMESAEQLKRAVAYATYPPEGARGIGAERATCWGQCILEHVREANENVLVVPIIESVQGGRDIRAMLEVPGPEVFFFGLHDYSSSSGHRGQWEGPGVAKETQAIRELVRAAGKHCGIITSGNEDMEHRSQQGFRMLGLGIDAGMLLRSLHAALAGVGRDQTIRASFQPESEPPPAVPMERPPESMRPDREEIVTAAGQGSCADIAPGILFECLVGQFNSARGLTTGLITCSPGAELPYHTHPYYESVTVLAGALMLEVEGRRYTLGPLDNMTIPTGAAHFAQNAAPGQFTLAHVSMATGTPGRTLVDRFFSRRSMGDEAVGVPGAERVTRVRNAKRFEAGKGASFIDYFNQRLMPGIAMSGGYGLFQPGGRLPAHIHDFDESICIIQGMATCVVEGRRYRLADNATALQPRGRVHYFVNESSAPMAMLWVYAGPMPERIVVDERCTTPEGNPWR